MTSGELVADTYLTFLGNIYLSHLMNTCWQVVADGYSELAALELCIEKLVLADIVHDETLDKLVGVLVSGPVV